MKAFETIAIEIQGDQFIHVPRLIDFDQPFLDAKLMKPKATVTTVQNFRHSDDKRKKKVTAVSNLPKKGTRYYDRNIVLVLAAAYGTDSRASAQKQPPRLRLPHHSPCHICPHSHLHSPLHSPLYSPLHLLFTPPFTCVFTWMFT
jgi:hypothetical protein